MQSNTATVPLLEAIAAGSLAEYMLTHPSQLVTFINTLTGDAEQRRVIVEELRKFYYTVSSQSGMPMAPLNIPAWLT